MAHQFSRIVMTTGVSAFATTNQYREWIISKGLLTWSDESPNPDAPATDRPNDALDKLKQRIALPGEQGLPEVADGKRVCAEYSALAALRQAGRLVDCPQLVIIHTDTFGGTAAAILVSRLLERDFYATVTLQPVALNVDDRNELRHGVGNFMQLVAAALQGYDTSTTCFMPLGGYKVMTSLGYLAGAYFGFPTLYIHEDKQILHEIPAVPVRVPHQDLKSVAPLMKLVAKGAQEVDLDEEKRKQLDSYAWLFERADGLVSVNAFGLFLMQEPEYVSMFATRIFVSQVVQDAMSTGGSKAFILQQLASLAGKLAAGSTEQDLQHEKQWTLESDNDRHLYKGASNGDLPFRCLYRFKNDELHIEFVWTNHGNYEEQAQCQWAKTLATDIDITDQLGAKP
jgi:putative CRISPR-associated protein (TIGR02619 family)